MGRVKPPSVEARERSHELLAGAVARSKRTSGIQLPRQFLREELGQDPPLSRMIRGGRGGEVRLKLYLCLVLIASKTPYDIQQEIPAARWAEMLLLPDPAKNGARRVADALSWLEDSRLIGLNRRPGAPPIVKLRSPTGDGRRFVRPRKQYLTVPLGLWQNDWITTLSATATALLLVLLDNQGGTTHSPQGLWFSRAKRDRYVLSDDTWTRATKELVDLGLVRVIRTPQGETFDWLRLRNSYWVWKDVLETPAP